MRKKILNKTSAGYRGNVSISLLKGRKPYHTVNFKNKGTDTFFNIICNAVIGNDMTDSMPKYISILESGDKDISLIRPHYTTTETVLETQGGTRTWYAIFTFIIPGSFLVNGKIINKVRLFNSIADTAPILAEIDLSDETEKIETDSSSNLMVVWKMSFTNIDK